MHLATCPDIRDEFWNEILSVMRRTGIKYQDDDKFKILGLINEPKTTCAEGLAILNLAWRCLYAEITKAKIEQTEVNLHKAVKRVVVLELVKWAGAELDGARIYTYQRMSGASE